MYRSKRSIQKYLKALAAQADPSSDPLRTNPASLHLEFSDDGQAPPKLDSAVLPIGSQEDHFQPQESASYQGPNEKHGNEFDPIKEVQMMVKHGKRKQGRPPERPCATDVQNSQLDLEQYGLASSHLDSTALPVGNHSEQLQPQGSSLLRGPSEQHASEFKPLEEVQIIVMKSGGIFTRWLGLVAKRGDYCPIDTANWKVVKKMMQAGIIKLIRRKFVLPGTIQADKVALILLGNKWRNFRHELKAKHLPPGRTQEQVVSVVPEGVSVCQWIKLVEYWFSKKGMTSSKLGKQARDCQQHLHTTGSKSYARLIHEFEMKHGRPPGIVEFFALSHQRRDGSYVDDATKEFLDQASSLIAQRRGTPSSSKNKVSLERDIFSELMGAESSGRVRGYGEGVTPSQISGLDAELSRMGHLRSSTDFSKEIERLKKMMKNESDGSQELRRLRNKMIKNKSDSSQEIKRLKKKIKGMEHKMVGMEMTIKELKGKMDLFTYLFQKPGIGVPLAGNQSEDCDEDSSDEDILQNSRRNRAVGHGDDYVDDDTDKDSEESSAL